MTLKLRIKIVELEPHYHAGSKKRARKIRDGYCKSCGSKLSDELSIKRGYGPRCFEKCTAIVFEAYEEGDK